MLGVVAAASSVESGSRRGVGLLRRCIWFGVGVIEDSVGVEVPGADKLVLERLNGREKLKEGLGK